jgi:hypothetical protein
LRLGSLDDPSDYSAKYVTASATFARKDALWAQLPE